MRNYLSFLTNSKIIKHIRVRDEFLNVSQRFFLSIVVVSLVLTLSWINPWQVTVTSVFLSAIASWAYWKGQDLRQIRKRKTLLGVAAFLVWGVVLFLFSTVIGHKAGIAAITILVSLKLFELDRRRDALVLVFMSQVLVMGLFFVSQDMFAAFCAVIMELMLLAGHRVLFYSAEVKWIENWLDIKLSGKMLFWAIGFGVLLFIAFPRPSEPLWDIGAPQKINSSGLSDTMEPGSIDDLVLSSAIAFQVEFGDIAPPAKKRYWRGPTMPHYRRGVWHTSVHDKTLPPIINSNEKNNLANSGPWDYRLIMEPSFRHWIYALETPIKIPKFTELFSDGLLQHKSIITTRKSFMLSSADIKLVRTPTKYDLSNLLRISNRKQYFEPQLRELANNWFAEVLGFEKPKDRQYFLSANETQQIVNKALNFFRINNFSYTLKPAKLSVANPMDSFLFNTQEGFCEYYSGAFTLLMRAAGIPARVVTGYQGGTFDEDSNTIVVRQSDAHAWSEVWIKGTGWVRVDPTSAVAPERIESSLAYSIDNPANLDLLSQTFNQSMLRQMLLAWEGLQNRWNRWVVLYDKSTQESLFSWITLSFITKDDLLKVFVAIILIFLFITYWNNTPKRTKQKKDILLWRKLINKLQKLDYDIKQKMTPKAVLATVEESNIKTHSAKIKKRHLLIASFIEQFIKLKYSGVPPSEKVQILKQLKKLYSMI